MAEPEAPLSWVKIVLLTLAAAVVSGMALGLLRELLGLSGGTATAGVGASTGVVAALLIGRRRAALAVQPKS